MIVKGISVRYFRNENLKRSLYSSIGDQSIPNSGFLKFSIEGTRDIIKDLKRLLNGEITLIEGWGDEQIYIDSEKEMSHMKDLMYDKTLPSVSTVQLLKLMEASLAFQIKIADLNYVAKLVKEAYKRVVQDSEKYKIWSEGNNYQVTIDDICIDLQLLRENGDFALIPEVYLRQIPKLSDKLLD